MEVYGFYLSETVKPREAYQSYNSSNCYSAEKTGYTYYGGNDYVTYRIMRFSCMELVEYFKKLASNPTTTAICRDSKYCTEHRSYYTTNACEYCTPPPKKSWAAVVKG